MSSETVLKDARKAGISNATLRRAKGSLEIQAKKSGFGQAGEWVWGLPEALRCSPFPKGDQENTMSALAVDDHLSEETASG